MKESHYPSLDLCKKLTTHGLPQTELGCGNSYPYYVMPSIAELLDELPTEVNKYFLEISPAVPHREGRSWVVRYYNSSSKSSLWHIHELEKRDIPFLPNALAEMWLWLKENNYLS